MEIENLELKKTFYGGLNERQRRQFAALEAKTLGRGGIKVVCEAFAISPVTVRGGIQELTKGQTALSTGKIRRAGGGRKKNSSNA
jgi:hypothetical protein